MKKNSIMDFLFEHAQKSAVSFHMPGHKGSGIYRESGYGEFLDRFMDCDITEIPGADNLFQPEGIIQTTMDRYASLYGVKKSHILINGTSCGLIASILACVPQGGKLIMARNCHKSVFNALSLGNISPVYAYPDLLGESGISGPISCQEIKQLLDKNPDTAAVILPSPNYYGICSNITAIADIVHSAGKILIVDQAHGAHLKFFSSFTDAGLPKSAEESGADIVVNSIHKTLASFTQSAVLNINSEQIDIYSLEDKLQQMESTSPSYLLMASLDINAAILEQRGNELMQSWAEDLEYFSREANNISDLRLVNTGRNMDRSKINLDMSAQRINGNDLEKLLIEKNIFSELTTGNILMCMTGIGNKRDDYEKLLSALKEISSKQENTHNHEIKSCDKLQELPRQAQLFPIPINKKRIRLEEAEGLICASSIIPYPPGIPLLCPGEKLEADAIAYIQGLREKGEKVIGINDLGEITVG